MWRDIVGITTRTQVKLAVFSRTQLTFDAMHEDESRAVGRVIWSGVKGEKPWKVFPREGERCIDDSGMACYTVNPIRRKAHLWVGSIINKPITVNDTASRIRRKKHSDMWRRWWNGETIEEIAANVGSPPRSVKKFIIYQNRMLQYWLRRAEKIQPPEEPLYFPVGP